MEGTSFTDSELLENQGESAAAMMEGADQLSNQELSKLNRDDNNRTRHDNGREDNGDGQCTSQSPDTPSVEALGKQLNNPQSCSKHLNTESNELCEGSKLENDHKGCALKEKEKLHKNELEIWSSKVKRLIQDKEDLQNTIDRMKDVLENNPSSVLMNNPGETCSDSSCSKDSNYVYSIQDIHCLVDLFLKFHNETIERVSKSFSLHLNHANADISNLERKILEISSDNNMLVVNNEKLFNLLTSEKESVSCLENSLTMLKTVVATKSDFMQNYENEKVLLVELLDHIEANEHLGDHLLSFTESLTIIKDIVQAFANKIIIISRKLLFINTELVQSTELCNDIKSDLTKLFDYLQFGQDRLGYSSVRSVKEELELVKEEYSQISSKSKEIGKSADRGKDVLESLIEEVNEIKQGILFKDVIINYLMGVNNDGQSEMKEEENETKNCPSTINSIVKEKACIENYVKTFMDEIFGLVNTIYKFNTDFPIETNYVKHSIERTSPDFKQDVQSHCLATDLKERITFHTSQYSILISYVKELQNKRMSTQNENVSLAEEVNVLKEHLARTKTHIHEADRFLNRIVSIIPFKISSIHQALEAVEHVFSEYKTLKEKEKVFLDEQQAYQDKLTQQQNNFNVFENCNSDLKVQLESYENEIRHLRSELRKLRSQCRRKYPSRVISNEQETQTGNLCCRELQDKVFKLEELAEARNLKITSLKFNIMNKNLTYKQKLSELECNLFQAKDKIRALKCELAEYKNKNVENIYSSSVKYDEFGKPRKPHKQS